MLSQREDLTRVFTKDAIPVICRKNGEFGSLRGRLFSGPGSITLSVCMFTHIVSVKKRLHDASQLLIGFSGEHVETTCRRE